MMKSILLPTDGSELSERAIGIAATLAHGQSAEIILAQVVGSPWWTATDDTSYEVASSDVYEQVAEAMEAEARSQLDRLASKLGERGVVTRSFLLKGSAAWELLALEERERPDLVVMASHGRTGLARFALGSIADRLVREGISPVLVVRAFRPEVEQLENALLPLDGSSLAEEALPLAEALAGAPLRSVKILRVIPSQEDVAAASAYVAAVAHRLTQAGLDAAPEVSIGEPATKIAEHAQTVDLVVLATHGRGGFDRLRHGSVAEQATRYLDVPVLLVRAHDKAGAAGAAPSEAAQIQVG
jgi:nucleotide-binding universal stress UspA family protein